MIDTFYDGILKIIVAISTGVLGIIPGVDGSDAYFTNTNLYVRNNQIYISTQIENPLNERIVDIIKSGRKIHLKIDVNAYTTESKEAVAEYILHKDVEYDILDKQYEINCNDCEETQTFKSPDEMWKAFLNIENQSVFHAKDFTQKANYYLKITAKIATELEIGGKKVDLMLFWNNKAPEYKTQEFDNSIFSF